MRCQSYRLSGPRKRVLPGGNGRLFIECYSHGAVDWAIAGSPGKLTIGTWSESPLESTKKDLQRITEQIHELCDSRGIELHVQWIPRGDNQIADYISKIVDSDDWGISDHIFGWLSSGRGTLMLTDSPIFIIQNAPDFVVDTGIPDAKP